MTQIPWLRVNPQIRSFILGEVERQHWLIGTPDYRDRVEWMTDAWMWAQEAAADTERLSPLPTAEEVLFLAARIEPFVNRLGYRGHNVRVGDHTAPSADRVPQMVEKLWRSIKDVTPVQGRGTPDNKLFTADDFYLEFEYIHPFGDGNGRTGKILHNWLLNRLDNPVLVADYFGGGNP